MEVQETTQSEIESINNSPLEVQDTNMKADSSLYEQKQFVSSQQKNNANVENNVEYPDLSTKFTTDRVFETRSDMIQWAQKVELTCGTVVVVSKSENATSDGTRSEDKWKVEVQCARHNHSLAISFEGHSFVGRLRPEQEKLVFDLIKIGVGPKHALNIIKDRDPNNSSTIRHIYNVKQKQRKLEKGDRTELQQLLHLLHNNGGVEVFTSLAWDNISPDVIVTDRDYALMNASAMIFPTAIKLLCRWHISKDVLAKGKREIRDWHSSADVQATEEKETQEKDMAETLCDKWAKVVLATTEAEYIHQLKELEKEFQRWPKFIHYLHQTWLKHKERFIAAWTDQHMHFGNTSTNRVEGAHSSLKRALTSSKYDFLGMWHMIYPSLTVQITEITTSFERSLIYVKHDHDILCFQNIRGFVSMNALDLIVGEMKRCSYVGMDNHICGCSLRRTHGLPCAHELNIIGLQGDKIHLEEINDFWKKLSITVVDVDLSDLGARPEFLALIDRYKNSTTDQHVFMLKQMLELRNPQCSGLLQPLVKTKTKGRPFGWRKELPKVDNSTKRDPSAFELEIHEFKSSQSAKPTTPTKKKLKVTKSTATPNKTMNVLKTPQSLGIVSILKFPDFFRPFIIDATNVDGDGNCGLELWQRVWRWRMKMDG